MSKLSRLVPSQQSKSRPKTTPSPILLIGGIDPTGHAGLISDAGVCQDFHVPYTILPTAIAWQNDSQYFGTSPLPLADFKKALKQCVGAHMKTSSSLIIKIGMLTSLKYVKALTTLIKKIKADKSKNLVVIWDPVFCSSSGGTLFPKNDISKAITLLLPFTTLITPNSIEYEFFKKHPQGKSAHAYLIKGGHTPQPHCDVLLSPNKYLIAKPIILKEKQLKTSGRRGTGCRFATAIACGIYHDNSNMTRERFIKICRQAKKYVWNYLKESTIPHKGR